MKRRCGVKQGLRNRWFHLQSEIKTRWGDSKNEIGFDVHHVYAYGPKTGAAFWHSENRGSVLVFFSSPVRSATEWTATQHVGWWGGVGCSDILELAHMVAATVNLYTWSMLR